MSFETSYIPPMATPCPIAIFAPFFAHPMSFSLNVFCASTSFSDCVPCSKVCAGDLPTWPSAGIFSMGAAGSGASAIGLLLMGNSSSPTGSGSGTPPPIFSTAPSMDCRSDEAWDKSSDADSDTVRAIALASEPALRPKEPRSDISSPSASAPSTSASVAAASAPSAANILKSAAAAASSSGCSVTAPSAMRSIFTTTSRMVRIGDFPVGSIYCVGFAIDSV